MKYVEVPWINCSLSSPCIYVLLSHMILVTFPDLELQESLVIAIRIAIVPSEYKLVYLRARHVE